MQVFSDLLLSLYRMARESSLDEFPELALRLAREHYLEFDTARWGAATFTPRGPTLHYTHLLDESPDMLRDYEEVKSQDLPVFDLGLAGAGFQSIRYRSRTAFRGRKTRGILAYARKYRHENNMLSWHIRPDDGFTNYLSTYRSDPDAEFSAHDRSLALTILPHLLEALAVNRMVNHEHLVEAGSRRRYLLGVADARGVVHHADPGFYDLLAREWSRIPANRLPAELVDLLARGERFIGRQVVAAARVLGELIFLKARAAGPADQLPPRELQVAKAVARGRTYREIAGELGISAATVRNHIQSIHEKLGVRNTAELIAKITLD
jgi:DNA-binding CsgD family transcriptional regulator